MNATIYHNPRCSKSREALRLLTEAGADVTAIDYLAAPLSREALSALLAKGSIAPRDALRPEADAAARATNEAALDAMAANPKLIERPIVTTAKGTLIARPPERALTLL